MDTDLFRNNEKRRFDRQQLYYYLKVNYFKTGRLAGYLGDISAQGLMLFSKKAVDLDQVFHFRINLDEGFGMDENLVFEARSLWCEKDANPEYYIIGFKFIDMNQASIDIVKYLIKKYGFNK
ncbi:MAG: PilZ domain-containing protein [Deltaproteobacteria bacterium]|nr:PilZ domain-containing protein [Deltaproteobacteria bacterium]